MVSEKQAGGSATLITVRVAQRYAIDLHTRTQVRVYIKYYTHVKFVDLFKTCIMLSLALLLGSLSGVLK